MDLSVVIVNYNVKYFLEQCLISVFRAAKDISCEVIVVDNHSSDNSAELVEQKFPKVTLIRNSSNLGFAKANNQALKQTNSRFVLLLNPDTLIEEDTLQKCLNYMDDNPSIGALGVKMIDGSGQFLPESKRGFPSPWAAFCKFSGISSLFPRSKIFNKYHLGNLPQDEVAEIDILCGAFMFIRKKCLDEVGLLDEDFFMYGEDIDLSHRIQKAGHKIVYFPETSIIHYKGESTRKSSLNYVRSFYGAMAIFAQKHFSKGSKNRFLGLLKVGIFMKALFGLISKTLRSLIHPALDFLLIIIGLNIAKDFWASYQFGQADYYSQSPISINFILYTSIWILSLFFSGGYDKTFSVRKILRSLGIGTLLILAVYGLLNTEYRSSRALILFGFGISVIVSIITRAFVHFIRNRNLYLGKPKIKKTVIVGSNEEAKRTLDILEKSRANISFSGFLFPDESMSYEPALGSFENLSQIVRSKGVDQVILCSKDLGFHTIMDEISKSNGKVEYKIVPDEALSIIGSSSRNVPGELYTLDLSFNINDPIHKRHKRLLDVITSIILLGLSPVLIWFQKNKASYIPNLFLSLIGLKAMVGYCRADNNYDKLPVLKHGLIQLHRPESVREIQQQDIHNSNLMYAKNYTVWKDIELFANGLFRIGE